MTTKPQQAPSEGALALGEKLAGRWVRVRLSLLMADSVRHDAGEDIAREIDAFAAQCLAANAGVETEIARASFERGVEVGEKLATDRLAAALLDPREGVVEAVAEAIGGKYSAVDLVRIRARVALRAAAMKITGRTE